MDKKGNTKKRYNALLLKMEGDKIIEIKIQLKGVK